MELFPIFTKVRGQKCVVVGSGHVAERKAQLLLKAGAQVTVLAPRTGSAILNLAGIQVVSELFQPQHLLGAKLVIAATDDTQVNLQVAEAAHAAGIWVNVVDTPSASDFFMPAIVDRSPLVIAVSSGGHAPVLARILRAKIEALIPATYGQLAQLAGDFRLKVKTRLSDLVMRMRFWEEVLQGTIATQMLNGQHEAAYAAMEQMVEAGEVSQKGEVYLVGGGPGDPDLLTFRALRLMQQCDVVLYDKLVSREVLELVRRDAERVNVGKVADQHTMPQQAINQLLVDLALQGKRVLRLKGGDPFIFGRGGEEIADLMTHGIPFQVVPGITAASGAACYAGIPLTHRDHAQAVVFVTGHMKDDRVDLDWPTLVRPRQTLVIYMGLAALAEITQQLQRHGLSGDTPAAVVQQATTQRQRVVEAPLHALAERVSAEQLKPPGLIIVGSVVQLRSRLSWFHAK